LEGQKRTTQKLAPAQALASLHHRLEAGVDATRYWAPLNQKNGVSY
jgi:hypothetical protein